MDAILNWNSETKYIKVIVRRSGDSAISLEEDVALSKISIYSSGYKGREYSYSGESLGLENKLSVYNIGFITADPAGLQDGAVYRDYLFAFNSAGGCRVYSSEDYSYISELELDKVELSKPHSNSACFGSYKYDESDEFPLLYVNIYNTYSSNRDFDGTCNVYRLQRSGKRFTSELVQIIKIGFTDDSQRWCSPDGDCRPYGNFAIDAENGRLYAFTMRDGDNSTRFFEFELPAIGEGETDPLTGVKRVVLTVDDITGSFSTPYFNYVQGCTLDNGRIYSLEGFTNDSKNKAALKVVDIERKELISEIDLYGMELKVEPEAIFVKDGVLYYIDRGGSVYEFVFH